MTHVINFFGGPGTGKSTTAAGLFFNMKSRGINCELAPEYAKDAVWGETTAVLKNQIYVFGKQHNRIHRLQGKVDYVITDSPLMMSCMYGEHLGETFCKLVKEEHYKLQNINIFLRRDKEYNPSGRMQNEAEAKEMDTYLQQMLDSYGIGYTIIKANAMAPVNALVEVLKYDLRS